jgi:protein-S-isoprenylcysteine O-methyltransferase Ste14
LKNDHALPLFRLIMWINYGLLFVTVIFFRNCRFPVQWLVGVATGGSLVLVSVALMILAHEELPKEHGQPERLSMLATNGVYSRIRHPVYLAVMLINLGLSLLFANYLMLILSILLVPAWYMVSKREEKLLIEKFGERYLEYLKQTPMFVPKRKKNRGKDQNSGHIIQCEG